MKKSILTASLTFLVFVASFNLANASLCDRGNGLIYDDVLNITWLQDANYVGGMTNVWTALSWVDQLEYGGYDNWRLPTTPATSYGYVNEGEMGHLYYNYGISSSNSGPFINIQDYWLYWATTESGGFAGFFFGGQYAGIQSAVSTDPYANAYVWAVHDGDVSVVPVPGAIWLFGSGLLALFAFVGVSRRDVMES